MPVTRSRRGFTLVELLIAIVLVGIVGVVIVRLLADTQRLTSAQGERAQAQASTRVGALVMPVELREVNPAMGDISAVSDTSISYRGMRNLAITCAAPTGTSVHVETSTVAGLDPSFSVNDSVLVFVEEDRDDDADDAWAVGVVTGIGNTACPDGDPGIALTIGGGLKYQGTTSNVPSGSFATGAPVRAFDHATLARYEDGDGVVWLGLRPRMGGSFEPIAGPLTSDGLVLSYLDGDGNSTMAAAEVRTILVELRAETRPVRVRGPAPAPIVDTLSTRITVRNGL